AEADLSTPDIALRNAGREALALSGLIETMLARLPNLMRHGDDEDFTAMAEADSDVDRRYALIKGYLTRIAPGGDRQAAEVARLLRIVVRLEQVGDVIAQRVAFRARKKRDRNVDFSDEGWLELDALFAEVMLSARLGSNVIASGDIGIARRLVEQKSVVRGIERRSTAHHLDRLREGRVDSRESSALHLDTLYDLKEINSLLVEICYPLLESEGQLRDNRLRGGARGAT
ncbi:MAG: PhoU domain-containing protein, partial [Beijerinckiaceae bacterium]